MPTDSRLPSDVNHIVISVVTVVFNGEKTLRETIKSMTEQTATDVEYLVVDGNSKDRTIEIIKEHEAQIKHWVSEPDRGIYDAMNKAIKLARGKYIYFLNSGDRFCRRNVLENAVTLVGDSPDALIGRVNVVGSGGGRFFPDGFAPELDARAAFMSHLCHQACFVRRDKLIQDGGFDMRYPHFADFHSTWRIAQRGRVTYAPDLIVADFNLDGVSSDWRYAIPLYIERERMLRNIGEKVAFKRWLFGLFRVCLYFVKMKAKAILDSISER